MSFDWRADEKRRAVEVARASLERIDQAISSLGRDLQIAQAAHAEYEADVRALGAQQFALRQLPGVEYTDADGFQQWGASPEMVREHERLADAIKTREREYQQWVNVRTERYYDGPIEHAWSPRNPISVEQRIQRLRVVRPQVVNQLAELEAALTPGQLLEIGGKPAPDYAQHRERVATLRERIETKRAV